MSEAQSSQQGVSRADLEAWPSNQTHLGPSRILIVSNGSKWPGESPDPLSLLIQRLKKYALDPMWEKCGNFASIAHGSFHHRGYRDNGEYVDYYEDTGPLYADAPYAVIFFGNFHKLSAGFSIVTDDPEIVEVLLEAIRTNQRSTAYQEARRDVSKRKAVTMSQPATEPEVESLWLKWGTLKSWRIYSEIGRALLNQYFDMGMSLSAVTQKNTPEQIEIICQLIDCCTGKVCLDWTGACVSKEEAKEYVRSFRAPS